MKIKTITYSRTYQSRPYEPERYELTAEVDDAEDPLDVLDELKGMVHLMHTGPSASPPTTGQALKIIAQDQGIYQLKKSPINLIEDPPFFEGGDKVYEPMPLAEVDTAGAFATEKQVRAIYAYGQSGKHYTEQQTDEACADIFGVAPINLTRAEASQFISRLKGEMHD